MSQKDSRVAILTATLKARPQLKTSYQTSEKEREERSAPPKPRPQPNPNK